MKNYYSKSKLILAFIALGCLTATKVSAQLGTTFFPQYGQNTEWTVDVNNELNFNGSLPMGSPAIVATTFTGLTNPGGTANDFTGLRLTFDAIVSSNGAENTTVVLSSNNTWGSKGIIIEINKFQIQGIKNFVYPGTPFSSNFTNYQNNIVKPGLYNNFIIDVDGTGLITVTVNNIVLPTTYASDITVLKAATPNPRYAYFCTGFTGFKMKNVYATKGATTNPYFISTLPISLVKYEATKKATGSQLNWETASESNNSHYLVYRSTDGANFTEIAKIAGKNQASKYQYLDASPASGNNYYKLVQFDFDGKSEELGVRVVNFDLQNNNTVSIYPKPATDKINLSFTKTFNSNISVKICDLSGREVQKTIIPSQKEPVNYVLNLDRKLTSGIYIINISSDQYNYSEKLMIK